jgi:hypothetical protein
MTRPHVTDFYMDGHVTVPFCKICSAEGDRLLDECQGPYRSGLIFFKDMTREEFEEKFGPVDQKKLDEMDGEIYIQAIR